MTLILACSPSTLSLVKLYWLKGGEMRLNRIQKHFGNLFAVSFLSKSDNFVSAERGPKCKELKSYVRIYPKWDFCGRREKE